MSRQTTVIVTCDRCKRVCDKDPRTGRTGPMLYMASFGEAVLDFGEMCPKCALVVDKLISKIRLDKTDNGDEGKGAGDE